MLKDELERSQEVVTASVDDLARAQTELAETRAELARLTTKRGWRSRATIRPKSPFGRKMFSRKTDIRKSQDGQTPAQRPSQEGAPASSSGDRTTQIASQTAPAAPAASAAPATTPAPVAPAAP